MGWFEWVNYGYDGDEKSDCCDGDCNNGGVNMTVIITMMMMQMIMITLIMIMVMIKLHTYIFIGSSPRGF